MTRNSLAINWDWPRLVCVLRLQMCVLIQDVHSGGVAAKDGRLQAGDQLLEVNGFDLTNATHLETRDALMQPYPVYRISLYRERADNQSFQEKEGFSTIHSNDILCACNSVLISFMT